MREVMNELANNSEQEIRNQLNRGVSHALATARQLPKTLQQIKGAIDKERVALAKVRDEALKSCMMTDARSSAPLLWEAGSPLCQRVCSRRSLSSLRLWSACSAEGVMNRPIATLLPLAEALQDAGHEGQALQALFGPARSLAMFPETHCVSRLWEGRSSCLFVPCRAEPWKPTSSAGGTSPARSRTPPRT
ncbi:hypothetical protein L596_029519 [Steinernema carpocapsae]|uniref:Uncharacterized protein n=1 Tax=Steinernema carpocapsae TaxID=34508 RepID=A0A4U5LUW5_STECR|nr:hypothetical protein L596_029519 [Steinernema carpocapsae]